MQFNKTLKLLICFVMIFPYLLNEVGASAASNYNHAELMEYEGYGKAMYEGLVEETTFITGQYTDNKEYVKDSIDRVKDYAGFWWEENKVEGESVGEKLKDVFVKGAAYTLTVGDWVGKFWSDFFDNETEELPPADGIFLTTTTHDTYLAPGYKVRIVLQDGSERFYGTGESSNSFTHVYSYNTTGGYASLNMNRGYTSFGDVPKLRTLSSRYRQSPSYSTISAFLAWFGVSITLMQADTGEEIKNPRPAISPPITKDHVNQIIADNTEMIIPQSKPSLTCPNGEKINLTVDGATFLNADGTVMLVNKDGTATVNGTSCALQWQTPEMDYIDGKAAMTDSEGNWIDMLTGEILECVVTGDCKPSVPDEESEELNKGLIEYVKNAYEYATGVLKTATDGLKSLATGAKDLTALFGTFFSWLPGEMVVLMSSGLGIAIGLRLFRK